MLSRFGCLRVHVEATEPGVVGDAGFHPPRSSPCYGTRASASHVTPGTPPTSRTPRDSAESRDSATPPATSQTGTPLPDRPHRLDPGHDRR